MVIKIWNERIKKGYKLEALAIITGISKSTLNNYENAVTSPTLKNLEKIAIALNCNISDLFDSEYK